MHKCLLFTAFTMLLPTVAWAGSFVDGVYTSNAGYSIRPPEDWVRLDASNAMAMKGHIPENITTDGMKRFDVVFFPSFSKTDTSIKADNKRIESNKATLEENKNAQPEDLIQPIQDRDIPPSFSPTVSVLVLSSRISATSSEMVKAYEASILENVKDGADYAKNFKVLDSTKDAVNTENGFVFKIRFTAGFREVNVEQTIITRPNDVTYIVTCTADTNEHLPNNWCQNVVGSMKFK